LVFETTKDVKFQFLLIIYANQSVKKQEVPRAGRSGTTKVKKETSIGHLFLEKPIPYHMMQPKGPAINFSKTDTHDQPISLGMFNGKKCFSPF